MKKIGPFVYSITSETDAYLVASQCRKHALELGLSEYQASLFNAAVSEIAINAVRYAHGGTISISSTQNNLGLEVTVEDQGEGIDDIEQALQDGYSTFKEQSLGLGLGVAYRCSDEILINKSDESGTSITLRKFLPVPENDIIIRAISHPAANQIYNRNTYLIRQYQGDTYFLALIDHSHVDLDFKKWHQSVNNIISDIITLNIKDALDSLLERCQDSLRNEGLDTYQIKICFIRINKNYIEHLSVNMHPIYWLNSVPSNLSSLLRSNSLDFHQRDFSYTCLQRPSKFTFLLHSRGVDITQLRSNQKWEDWDVYKIATTAFNDCALEYLDATVLVIRGEESNVG